MTIQSGDSRRFSSSSTPWFNYYLSVLRNLARMSVKHSHSLWGSVPVCVLWTCVPVTNGKRYQKHGWMDGKTNEITQMFVYCRHYRTCTRLHMCASLHPHPLVFRAFSVFFVCCFFCMLAWLMLPPQPVQYTSRTRPHQWFRRPVVCTQRREASWQASSGTGKLLFILSNKYVCVCVRARGTEAIFQLKRQLVYVVAGVSKRNKKKGQW